MVDTASYQILQTEKATVVVILLLRQHIKLVFYLSTFTVDVVRNLAQSLNYFFIRLIQTIQVEYLHTLVVLRHNAASPMVSSVDWQDTRFVGHKLLV